MAAALLTVKQYRGFHINSLIYFFPVYVFSLSACDLCGDGCKAVWRHRAVYTEALDDDGDGGDVEDVGWMIKLIQWNSMTLENESFFTAAITAERSRSDTTLAYIGNMDLYPHYIYKYVSALVQ